MLTLDIQSILNSIPNEISWQDIVQFEKLDDRVAIANDPIGENIHAPLVALEQLPPTGTYCSRAGPKPRAPPSADDRNHRQAQS